MTTLVTGAGGFIGSAVVRRLLAEGHDVRVLMRAGSDNRNLEGLKVEVANGDVRDRGSLDRAVAGCDTLFHVAAVYQLWSRDPQALYATNVTGTLNIMHAAAEAGVKRIVYTSSTATLGLNADGVPSDEQTPIADHDLIGHYKRSKFLAEQEVQRCARDLGLAVVIVNPSTTIGPRDIKPTPTGRVIVKAARGRLPAFVNTGLNVVHVDDVAEGHLRGLERGKIGERYVLGGDNITLEALLARVARAVGRSSPKIRLKPNLVLPIAYVAEAWARVTHGDEPLVTVSGVRMSRKPMYFSVDKARRELGYDPRPATVALDDAVRWFQAHGYCR